MNLGAHNSFPGTHDKCKSTCCSSDLWNRRHSGMGSSSLLYSSPRVILMPVKAQEAWPSGGSPSSAAEHLASPGFALPPVCYCALTLWPEGSLAFCLLDFLFPSSSHLKPSCLFNEASLQPPSHNHLFLQLAASLIA